MLFNFFSEATSRALTSIVSREPLVRKMEFPRLVIPLSIVLAATFTLGLNLLVVLGYMLVTGVPVSLTWLLLPVLILLLYVFTMGTSLLLSTAFVSFRDTAQIWTVMSPVVFWTTPVILPIEFYPAAFKPVLLLNPLAPIFAQARVWILDPSAPTYSEAMEAPSTSIYPLLVFLATVVSESGCSLVKPRE